MGTGVKLTRNNVRETTASKQHKTRELSPYCFLLHSCATAVSTWWLQQNYHNINTPITEPKSYKSTTFTWLFYKTAYNPRSNYFTTVCAYCAMPVLYFVTLLHITSNETKLNVLMWRDKKSDKGATYITLYPRPLDHAQMKW